jgi:DNA-binding LacI/PurR family transcriptional regulator
VTVTVKDVAREAGVSRTTVSNVFNGRAKYSRETEEAVLEAARRLSYKPNLAAQSLITNKSHLIGLVLPSYVDKTTLTNSPFYNIIIDGVTSVLRDVAYYDVILSCVSDDDQALNQVSDWADVRNVDGIIAIGQYDSEFLKALEAKEIPVILIDNYQRQFPTFSYINSDDEMGGYLATRRLIESGHANIALCSIAPQSPLMQRRYAGYQRAMQEAHYPEHYFEGSTFSAFEDGKSLGESLVSQGIDAAFCTEDMLAVGVLHTLVRMGVNVGSDFGLVGFDNIPMSRYIYPELTTVDQNIAEKGETATRTLLNILKEDSLRGTRLILPVSLVERSTTRG